MKDRFLELRDSRPKNPCVAIDSKFSIDVKWNRLVIFRASKNRGISTWTWSRASAANRAMISASSISKID